MTWKIQDIMPDALLPLPIEEPVFQASHTPPMAPSPFFETDDPAIDWMTTLSPAERDMAQRSGFFPMQQWERWRQRMTRGCDGIL